jgi:glycosyltransferase involved in cell wall biosynthesis
MSAVIVPSKHTAECFKKTGTINTPLEIIPEAYASSIDGNSKSTLDDLDLKTPFNFLVFGQITGNNPENDRKNIFYTIKWLCEVFKDDQDVGIVIKTNAGRNTEIDKRLVTQTINSVISGVRKGPFPKIHLLHGNLSDNEVASLYRHPKIKGLISLTRGEGYGLPLLEAAASDLPVIATGWSGHVDFLSRGKYIDIAYNITQVHPTRVDNAIFVAGSMWASPNEDDFKRKIVKFRNGHTIPKEWAQSLGVTIRKEYSIDSIIKTYDRITKEWL